MKKRLSFLLFLLTNLWLQVSAQDRQLTGLVTSIEDGQPLPGVSISVKGTNKGTTTNGNGAYQLNVGSGSVLVFSYVGFVTKEVNLGNESELNVSLQMSASSLSEVVVTALGIERDKKALGYNVQDLKNSEITQARPTNLVNALSGKIAGIQVTNSNGQPGASSRIMIRGANSIGGNNQPLFVVDGIPIDNGSYNTAANASATNTNNVTVDYGNGASAINPDDIDNISVLKGANAAALYGSRAANGVILITTKSGKGSKGIGISVNSNVTFDRPFRLPDWQNEYGQGFGKLNSDGTYGGGVFEYVDGKGGGINDGVDESWGPKMDGRLIAQFNSPIDPATGKRIPTPWVAHPDNVKNFHETGLTTTNNVAITGGSDKGDFRLSFTNLYQKGMYPNTNYKRKNLSFNAGYNLTPKLHARAAVNYIKDGSDNRQNLNLYWIWFGRQVDLEDLKQDVVPGTDPSQWPVQRNWNSNYWNNPYYVLNRQTYANDKDRVVGNVQLTYQLLPWLKVMGRSGTDFGMDRRITKRAKGVGLVNGEFAEDNVYVQETNTDFLVTGDRKFGDFQATVSVGGNHRYNYFQRDYLQAPELRIPNLYNIANSAVRPNVYNRNTKKVVNSVYGQASFSFRDYLFMDLTARNDWSSTLPANPSYFYPSISGSAVLTDALNLQSPVLSYLKARAGWAQVGNDTDPYATQQVYQAEDAWGSVTTFSENNLIYNSNLKPEMTKAFEAGIETRLFKNLINLEITYYDKSTSDQILRANVPQSSGYYNTVINGGKIRNSGIEVELSASPIKLDNGFRWDVTVNYARNRSEVVDLGGLSSYQINTGSLLRNVILEARPGYAYGNFYGTYTRRAPDGQAIIDASGYPVMSSDRKVIGNIMPKWTGGLQTAITYKNFSVSTLFDMRFGGQIFSQGINIGRYTGVLKETLPGRETGNIVAPGVTETKNADGSTTYTKNTKAVVLPENYYHNFYNRNNNENYMFDASYVKWRELRISYTIPSRWVSKTPFRNITVSAVGRNLALLYSNVPHIDPETSYYGDGNVQGFENGNLPSARSIGFNVGFGL
ncbi:SusC/RagA family TonB-linked outer membrane protein [Siphonobacter sp. SORGH_AS_0500]|uniref:SusC/RagA family TonB-linked outer membrane protein n=1 Tax=Siphonobacter sp. SORGH_AS_0500 TaxID=1864824 RepID=UPI000CCA5903|nr:SusC/RagA family TonB-linked outer membrane protein [Siphonobacter sp. SORGH_AS_0500]PKK37037.1 SusC/RagA family TonB-linked outer membrane protein [Siphonobacter sp. SORGH_AS_0500]